eukprot:gene14327-19218_t
MNRSKLLNELKKRCITAQGSTPVLVARLLKVMVDEGLMQRFEAGAMSDLQPEKWLLLANQVYFEACELEGDPEKRVTCMKSVNDWILKEIKSADMLRQVAGQQLLDPEKSDLFKILLRYATALMVCPDVQSEAIASSAASSNIVAASMFMFDMMTGYGKIPDHLTEQYAINEEQEMMKKSVRSGKSKFRKFMKVKTDSEETVEVQIGSEVFVDLGDDQLFAQAKVSRLETSEQETIVFAKPVSSQFGGPHFEFQMTIQEYLMAAAQADSDNILSSLADGYDVCVEEEG